MLAPPGDMLRAGFELKLNRVKRATNSYLRDRTRQATGSVTSYAVAAGLFVAAGIFLIAACLVGLTALFRWVELKYGLFPAFGIVGGLLVLLALACVGIAMLRLRRRPLQYPSLASRLRVAIAAPAFNTPKSDSPAAANSFVPSTPKRAGLAKNSAALGVPVGLGVAALLVGLAAARRRQRPQQ